MEIIAANLTECVSEEDIRSVFEPFGKVINVIMVMKRLTGISSGVAFLEMPERPAAENAVRDLNFSRLRGRALVVIEVLKQFSPL